MPTMSFHFDDIPPGLNGNGGLMRMNHWGRTAEKQRWMLAVMSQKSEAQSQAQIYAPMTKVRVAYVIRSPRAWDWDNAASTFKMLSDALVAAEVITNDSSAVIISFEVQVRRVKNRERGCDVFIAEAKNVEAYSVQVPGAVSEEVFAKEFEVALSGYKRHRPSGQPTHLFVRPEHLALAQKLRNSLAAGLVVEVDPVVPGTLAVGTKEP